MLLSNIQFLVQYIDILHLPIIAADTYDISVDSNLKKENVNRHDFETSAVPNKYSNPRRNVVRSRSLIIYN